MCVERAKNDVKAVVDTTKNYKNTLEKNYHLCGKIYLGMGETRRVKNKDCRNCGKKGHFAVFYKSLKINNKFSKERSDSTMVKEKTVGFISKKVGYNDVKVPFILYTGSQHIIINIETAIKFGVWAVERSNTKPEFYTDSEIDICGKK